MNNFIWFINGAIISSLVWHTLWKITPEPIDHASMFCYNQGFNSYTIDETGNVFCSTKGIEK